MLKAELTAELTAILKVIRDKREVDGVLHIFTDSLLSESSISIVSVCPS
jgi:hypothetical protein